MVTTDHTVEAATDLEAVCHLVNHPVPGSDLPRPSCATIVRVSLIQCESNKITPKGFSDVYSQNGWEFLVQIFHAYYAFLTTLDYEFLFNYLKL